MSRDKPHHQDQKPIESINNPKFNWSRMHHSWIFWVFFLLMLLAIGFYITSVSFSTVPEKQLEKASGHSRTL